MSIVEIGRNPVKMTKDILVAIVSDDIYARNWMSLLLVRDWRTRVVSEITCHADFARLNEPGQPQPDLFLVDLDSYRDNPSMLTTLNELVGKRARILCVGTQVIPNVFLRLDAHLFAGYLLKNEISSSLAWAITFAYEDKTVFTPGVMDFLQDDTYKMPANKMIIRGRSFPGLTDRQEEIARLAIVFSIGRRDLADELKISDQWSYGMVSELYSRLGLEELFTGEIDPSHFVWDDPVILEHLEEILDKLGDSKKARDLETLAFHLLTMPSIEA
jgi:DNA-binding NarL/FixJ family response regulator